MIARRILVTGATGFVGRALLLRLARDRRQVTALVRDPARARRLLGDDVTLVPAGDRAALAAAVADADAVINLAGEPIADRRWTSARKRALRDSRVGVTEALAEAARARPTPPPVLVSASAVGIYGDRGNQRLDERAAPGEGFAAELCTAWERAAREVGAARTVLLRIGVVLGAEGGALARLVPLVRTRLAGPIGGGRQWVPWIHLADLVELIVRAIDEPRWSGPVNAVAPHPVTQRALMRVLAEGFGGAAVVPAPALAVRAVLGERARLLLDSARVEPAAALARGHHFAFPTLSDAVRDLAGRGAVSIERVAADEVPDVAYLAARRPRYVLESTVSLAAPLDEVFDFFSDAGNLERLTPPTLGFRILTPQPIAMAEGATIDYSVSINRVPTPWRSVIARWQPGACFVDAQERGPYRAWWHEHHFAPGAPGTTVVHDRVYYAPPLGPLGRIAHAVFVRRMLQRIFTFRRQAMALRFG